MVSTTLILLSAASLVSALPPKIGTTNLGSGRASLKQVRNPRHVSNGALSVYKTYLKYGVEPPDYLHEVVYNLTGINVKRTTGHATTTPIDTFDDAYITPVSIGTPPPGAEP